MEPKLRWNLRFGLTAVSLLASLSPVCRAAQFYVLTQQSGRFQILEAEKITLNGKEKVRVGNGKESQLRPEEYKRSQAVEFARLGVIRRHPNGYLVRRNGSAWEPFAPDGSAPKAAIAYTDLWSSATLALHNDRASKTGNPIAVATVWGILPGSDRNEAVASLIEDKGNFQGLGQKDDAASADEQMSLLIALGSGISGAPGERLQQMLLSEMDSAIRNLSSGMAKFSELQRGQRFAGVSERAYPDEPRQKRARKSLADTRAWLEKRISILRALDKGELWDAFLDKYGDFERFDNSFEELRKEREKAYLESTRLHFEEGKRLYEAKQFSAALHELRLAHQRNPGAKDVETQMETVRIDEAHDNAKRIKRTPEDPKSPRQTQLRRLIANANNYMSDGKLDQAEAELVQAEAMDRDSSAAVMLTRVKLLQARKDHVKAIEVLDRYDRLFIADEDVTQGETVRSRILYELNNMREKYKTAMREAQAAGDFKSALDSAVAGAKLDPSDPEFALAAGLNSAVLRNKSEALKFLEQYLRLAQGPGANAKQKVEVYGLINRLRNPDPQSGGVMNWFSGYKSTSFYDPLSLAVNARPVEAKASKKTTSFNWNGDQLASVRTSSTEPGGGSFNGFFDYFKGSSIVRRVLTESAPDPKEDPGVPKLTSNGASGTAKGTYVVLPNHPQIDPLFAQSLMGKSAATVVAGNPYFQPFVWNSLCVFVADYDDQGRIKSARQVAGSDQLHNLEFEWEGSRLVKISEAGTGDYVRSISYSGDRPNGESIQFRGRPSRIEYKYRGDALVEAVCAEDPSLDTRTTRVTFR